MDPDAVDEKRFVAIGLGGASELLVVVYTVSRRRHSADLRKTCNAQ
jgi:uncharacterized DUF497 family protein